MNNPAVIPAKAGIQLNKRRFIRAAVVVVAVLLMAVGRSAMADDNEATRATLKGIPGVYVRVADFTNNEKTAGFNKRIFQTDMELKLRLVGIKVFTQSEWIAIPGNPYLFLELTSLSKQRGQVASFNIDLEFNQTVNLARNSDFTEAVTWSVGGVGNGGLPFVREQVKDYMDKFINAWLSVNPKN